MGSRAGSSTQPARRQRHQRPRWLAAALLAAVVAVAAAPVAAAAAAKQSKQLYTKEGDVIILTDDNFDQATATGVWMLDIYAPWCSHCQQMEPAWAALATELKRAGVHVAKADGMQNRVLMKRFGVLGFPSIYLLRDGGTWQYTGIRTVQDLKDFALEGYRDAPRLPTHKAPNSAVGRAMGLVYSLPLYAKRGYGYLREQRGLSDAAIIAGLLLLPLTVGAAFICVLDAMYTRRGAEGGFDGEHEHYE